MDSLLAEGNLHLRKDIFSDPQGRDVPDVWINFSCNTKIEMSFYTLRTSESVQILDVFKEKMDKIQGNM